MARRTSSALPRRETDRDKLERFIEQLLHDDGPHTREQISNQIGRKLGTTSEILNNMRQAGIIKREKLRQDHPLYWILASD